MRTYLFNQKEFPKQLSGDDSQITFGEQEDISDYLDIYLFKVNYGNNRAMAGISSKTPEGQHDKFQELLKSQRFSNFL